MATATTVMAISSARRLKRFDNGIHGAAARIAENSTRSQYGIRLLLGFPIELTKPPNKDVTSAPSIEAVNAIPTAMDIDTSDSLDANQVKETNSKAFDTARSHFDSSRSGINGLTIQPGITGKYTKSALAPTIKKQTTYGK
jgi:hypothetical protein